MKANVKRNIMIDENGNGIVTKAFAKQAKIYGTEEYKLWREFIKDNKNAKMVHKTIKKNPEKKSEPKISYNKMREFIKVVGTKDDLDELEKQIKLAKITQNPHQTVMNWFKKYDKYEEYLKSVAENEVTEDNKKNATITAFPKAVNN